MKIRSASLIRFFDYISYKYSEVGLSGKKILDYGCGYGRLIRLMNYFSDHSRIYGVDAMKESLDIAIKTGVKNPLSLVQQRPIFDEAFPSDFEFVYLFSIFSHTPIAVTTLILSYLSQITVKDCIVACSFRTIDWLAVRRNVWPSTLIDKMELDYQCTGYGYVGLNGDDGSLKESDYGDTIMTPSFFNAVCLESGWNLIGLERDMIEPFQIFAILKRS